MRQQVASLAVVLLVGLAGCAGGLSGADGTPDVSERAWTDGESVEVDAVFESHRSVVATADSVTKTTNVSSGAAGWTRTVVRVNRSTERLYSNTTLGGGSTTGVATVYVADGTQYGKVGPVTQPEYSSEPLREEFGTAVADLVTLSENASVVAQWNWTYAGYEDGAFRFEADGLDPDSDAPVSVFGVPNATSGTGTLVVEDDGVLRRLSLETVRAGTETGSQRETVAVTTSYRSLNETTVAEPGWLDET